MSILNCVCTIVLNTYSGLSSLSRSPVWDTQPAGTVETNWEAVEMQENLSYGPLKAKTKPPIQVPQEYEQPIQRMRSQEYEEPIQRTRSQGHATDAENSSYEYMKSQARATDGDENSIYEYMK